MTEDHPNISDTEFKHWIVVHPHHYKSKHVSMCLCKCKYCDNKRMIQYILLNLNLEPSCSCELGRLKTFPNLKIKAYKTWSIIKAHCDNENNPNYHNYGGRGIVICEKWKEFDVFFKDMGTPPPGLSIGRIDNDAGYSKENCRWETPKEQAYNNKGGIKNITQGLKLLISALKELLKCQ